MVYEQGVFPEMYCSAGQVGRGRQRTRIKRKEGGGELERFRESGNGERWQAFCEDLARGG